MHKLKRRLQAAYNVLFKKNYITITCADFQNDETEINIIWQCSVDEMYCVMLNVTEGTKKIYEMEQTLEEAKALLY